jgi:hypothetical protein
VLVSCILALIPKLVARLGAGVLVSRGLLHEDVFLDGPFALELVWAKIGPILEEWQAAAGIPGVWENVARLGKRNEVWRQTK